MTRLRHNFVKTLIMRELVQIIEDLHRLNQQIIDKDNLLAHYAQIIDLTCQLMKDPQLTQLTVYPELKARYLTPIETHLNSLQTTSVSIEPENPEITSAATDRATTFSSKDVTAPIVTDIYTAPKQRPRLANPKKTTKATPTTKKTQEDPAQMRVGQERLGQERLGQERLDGLIKPKGTTLNLTIEMQDESVPPMAIKDTYIAFDYQDTPYYLETRCQDDVYVIRNQLMENVGCLKHNHLTLKHDGYANAIDIVIPPLDSKEKINCFDLLPNYKLI